MLREIIAVKQHDGVFLRRWFNDEVFDLFVWYDLQRCIIGFQLCYDKGWRECALTWLDGRGYSHDRVDSGERSAFEMRTPVLIGGGTFPYNRVTEGFIERSGWLDPEVRRYVIEKLNEYPKLRAAA